MIDVNQAQVQFDANGLFMLNIALAIVMFGVALGINLKDFKQLFKQPKPILIGLLSQFILLPLVTFLLVLLIKPVPSIALGMFMVAACPGGNISNFMTHLSKGNTALSVSLTAFASALALFFTPFNFQLYGNLYQPTATILKAVTLHPMDIFKIMILILGIPLLLGMLFNSYNPKLAVKLSNILKPISILIFVSIVVIAFSKNLDVFTGFIHHVLAIGVGHNIVALLLGFSIAKLFRLSFKNQKTLSIETGIQNSGLGLLLVFTFFNGLGGMAVLVAFWGIWHIISGLILSFFWSKTNNT
ncbi:bile acid:sodium symporter family protein [Olleya aquimaris]|uniref:BASS family bile acid:Na+ symporter n=1 Tax=Olleya aquimaris TaxID=639310 RepID=A0A327RL94_9FLAO|nr:bile acid:sodium symporter family protein [Olleya aquimaris]RAJ16955.1 BASS family bile acid:Na+ symporter [Olleya aquimaris]